MNLSRGCRVAALGLGVLLVGACGDTRGLTVVGFGGTYQELQRELIFDPFAQSRNTPVNDLSYSGEYGSLANSIENQTNTWSIVQVESSFLLRGAQDGLLEEIDYEALGDVELLPSARHSHGVAHIGWATTLSWNASRLPVGAALPDSWTALWDTIAYPGLRLLRQTPRGNLELALLADGVPVDSVYPLDVPRALQKLDEIKPHIQWWSSGAESQQKLLGSATLGALWNGRVWALQQDGQPIGMSLNQAIIDYDWWVVPAGQADTQGGRVWDFLRFASSPEVQRSIAERYGYAPTTVEGVSALPLSVAELMPTSGANMARGLVFDSRWWAENEQRIADEWNRWLLRSR